MEIDQNKATSFLKIIIILSMISFVLYLISQKIVIDSELIYKTDFNQQQKFIQGPYPEGRVQYEQDEKQSLVEIIHEPIYVEVYNPRKFKQAEVTIKYQKPDELPAKLGLKLKTGDWAFFFENLEETDSKWHEQTLTFNLQSAEIVKNKIKFILSAPGIDSLEKSIKIDYLKFKLIK